MKEDTKKTLLAVVLGILLPAFMLWYGTPRLLTKIICWTALVLTSVGIGIGLILDIRDKFRQNP